MKNFNAITHAHVWVLDHQEALDFYVGKLGLEVKADYTRGGFRWLTVGVEGEAVPEIALDVPGPPVMDEKTAEQVRELVTKGASGFLVLRTDDCFGTHERLRAKGVEFTQEPTDNGYAVDCGLRDPFGNQIRILQPKAWG
jgi:catechol 2,3-dioxygenase-like lactoylglutathione lyase family enzyme